MKGMLLGGLLMLAMPVMAGSVNDSPQDLLQSLYRLHDNGQGPFLDPAAKADRERFFTTELAHMLDQELNSTGDDEVGRLDFDPFYNAQDTEISGFDIAVPKVSGPQVTALVHFLNFGQSVEIGYRLIQDARGWRIDDIDYGDGHSLRKILAGE
jgi:hypothetical protein